MILSALTGISLGSSFIAILFLFRYRDNPAISFRDPYLTTFIGVVVALYCSFMAFVYDSPEEYWSWRCKHFVGSLTAVACFFVGVPVVCRIFNIQFYYHSSESKFHESQTSHFRKLKFLTTRKWQAIVIGTLYALSVLCAVIIYHGSPHGSTLPTYHNYPECINFNLISFALQAVPMTLSMSYLILKFINFRDPFGIKTEFTFGLLLALMGVPAFVIIQAVDVFYKQFHPDEFQPMLFAWAISLGYLMISTFFPLYYAYTHVKRIQRSSSQTNVTLDTVLENPVYLESFKKQVAQFWCSEALLFSIDVKEFQSMPSERLKERAFTMIQEYIVEGSENQININKRDQKAILQAYQNNEIFSTLFDDVFRDVQGQLFPILIRWKQDQKVKEGLASDSYSNNMAPLRPIAH